MTNETTWYVVNNQGHIAGHDLSKDRANDVLNEMIDAEPDGEWEAFDASDDN